MTYTVLVVEDEKPISQVLEIKLTRNGIGVVVAYNGREAIEKLSENMFDFILLDLMMPEVDGFEVLQHMRDTQNTTPVCVTTNLSQEEDRVKAFELGAKEYIVKSDTPLATIVQKVLDHFSS